MLSKQSRQEKGGLGSQGSTGLKEGEGRLLALLQGTNQEEKNKRQAQEQPVPLRSTRARENTRTILGDA